MGGGVEMGVGQSGGCGVLVEGQLSISAVNRRGRGWKEADMTI